VDAIHCTQKAGGLQARRRKTNKVPKTCFRVLTTSSGEAHHWRDSCLWRVFEHEKRADLVVRLPTRVRHSIRSDRRNSNRVFHDAAARPMPGRILIVDDEPFNLDLLEQELGQLNELLDLAKIEAGHIEVYAENFKIEDIVRVATATVEPMLKNGTVRLVTELPADLPPIKSDRDKLKQIVLNLLSNSAKFTESGEIRVTAWRDNGALKLAVADTGIGMKAEALKYIFDEFRQVDMSTTRKYGGTGLGLAIVKRLTNLLGGEIAVESREGKGTTFTVTLPLTDESA
jgi:signal transduction histidine kinase